MAYYYGNFLHTNYVYRRTECMHHSMAKSTRRHRTKLKIHFTGTMQPEKSEFKRNTDQMNIQYVCKKLYCSKWSPRQTHNSFVVFAVVIGRSSLLHQKWSSHCKKTSVRNFIRAAATGKCFRVIIIIILYVHRFLSTRLIELWLRNWCAQKVFDFTLVPFASLSRTGISIHILRVDFSHALGYCATYHNFDPSVFSCRRNNQ